MDQIDLIRASAVRRAERYSRLQQVFQEQGTSLAKWLTASLLAINGGGGLTALDRLKDHSGPVTPAILFLIGICSAMASGWFLQVHYLGATVPVINLEDYWREVGQSGVENDAHSGELYAEVDKLQRWTFLAPLCGWISMIMFIAGAVCLGIMPAATEKGDACRGTSPANAIINSSK